MLHIFYYYILNDFVYILSAERKQLFTATTYNINRFNYLMWAKLISTNPFSTPVLITIHLWHFYSLNFINFGFVGSPLTSGKHWSVAAPNAPPPPPWVCVNCVKCEMKLTSIWKDVTETAASSCSVESIPLVVIVAQQAAADVLKRVRTCV